MYLRECMSALRNVRIVNNMKFNLVLSFLDYNWEEVPLKPVLYSSLRTRFTHAMNLFIMLIGLKQACFFNHYKNEVQCFRLEKIIFQNFSTQKLNQRVRIQICHIDF